jgi:hypothetical protein
MGAFSTARIFETIVPDLAAVAQDVAQHFKEKGYEVNAQSTATRSWLISISKGGTFKAVLGMKTALNIELEPTEQGTSAKASVGIFGRQAVPALISLFVFWPVLITQIAGIVQQAKLDDEAIAVIERSLALHSGGARPLVAVGVGTAQSFCTSCGAKLQPGAKFCSACGVRIHP